MADKRRKRKGGPANGPQNNPGNGPQNSPANGPQNKQANGPQNKQANGPQNGTGYRPETSLRNSPGSEPRSGTGNGSGGGADSSPGNSGNHTHAPYNFVSFSNKIITPVSDWEELTQTAGHDKIRPDRLTGEIRLTLEADTPVFIGDGNKNDSHFFRDAQGRFCIPGSTVRGMLRQNMKILGYGLVRAGEDLEDQRLYFREMAAAKSSVGDALKEYYQDALQIRTYKTPDTNKSYSVPENVRSGWLEKRDGKFRILPTAEPYLRVSRKSESVQRFKKNGEEPFAQTIPVAYSVRQDSERNRRAGEILPLAEKRPDMKEGALLYTGHWVGNHPNHIYLFPAEVTEAEAVNVSDEDELAYREDYENRKNGLRGNTWHIDYDVDFWNLPNEGERKPVFYVWHGNRLSFGMSLFLRIEYWGSVAQGLPEKQQASADALDYTDILLGYTRKDPTTGKYLSFASRVSVGDFPALGKPEELDSVSMILGNPKPTYYPGYLKDGRNYNDRTLQDGQAVPAFQLRGHKQYWLKDVEETSDNGKSNVGTVLRPLGKGTKFRGVIRFENLTREELGLVIWCLRLKRDSGEQETYYQSLGMGKPYGYGRMKVTLDRVLEFDTEAMYRPEDGDALAGLFHGPRELDAGTIDGYVAAYDRSAAQALPKRKKDKKDTLLNHQEIQDFLYMKRTVQSGETFAYMGLDKYTKVRSSLPTVDDIRKAAEQAPQQPEEEDNSMEALLRRLREKNRPV